MSIKSIAVFCGSSLGSNANFEVVAKELGALLANKNITLIYGAAKIGVMGAIAQSALDHSGKVTGVIPTFLMKKEVVHKGLTKLIVADTMHERKQVMYQLSEGFIVLPGGFGTMDELFEVLTWSQLNLHQKPIGLLNVDGFYDSLLEFLKTQVENKLVKQVNLELLIVRRNIEDLLIAMDEFKPSSIEKWQ